MNRIDIGHGGEMQSRWTPWWQGTALAALTLVIAFAAWTVLRSPGLPLPSTSINAPTAPALRAINAHDAAAQYLQFEPNRGQAAKAVRYLSRGPTHSVEVFDDGIALSALRVPGHAGAPATMQPDAARAQLRFVGSRQTGRFEEREPAPGYASYLLGPDASSWIRGVPRFRQLRYAELYPGIDLVYYSRQGELEFDLVVKPGADASRIRLRVGGTNAPAIADNGDLLLDGENGALRLHRPVLYQNIDGEKSVLEARYVLTNERELSFALPAYDKRYPLVIDPVFKLLYSTYLGGVHDDQVGAMALDAQGNAYVIGNSGSEDWPVSGNAYQSRRKAIGQYVRNVVVTKFDASGTLIYSTFIGGSTNDYGTGIAVDAAGNAYLTGNTTSSDFPVTTGAAQSTFKGVTSAYLAILSPDGSALRHSTFYGGSGSSEAQAIALDASGAPVLAGTAGPGLATTAGAYKTTLAAGRAAFVARFSPLASGAPQLMAASYFGVDNPQANSLAQGNSALGMALDSSGAAWITGQAFTTNLPTTSAATQAAPTAMSSSCVAGPAPLNSFAYLAKLSADLSTLGYASYFSGKTEAAGASACSEFGRTITLDAAGNVYLAGGTASATFPVTAGALQATLPIGSGYASYSSFVSKLKPDGSALLWSSYFGGNVGSTFAGASLVAHAGTDSLWMTVVTGGGNNYPVTADALQPALGGGSDAGVVQFNASTGALRYSTYLGGSGNDAGLAMAVDAGGNAFIAGATTSANFPVTSNAFQPAITAGAFDGSDWFFSVLGSGTIGRVQPASGGSGGDVTLTVHGAGFQSGATVVLTSGSLTLTAASAATPADGVMTATFALNGAAPGVYDLTVKNPDGSTFAKNGAFTVTPGGAPQVSVNVIGRSKIRNNTPATFTVNLVNSGNVDAYFQTLWISFPSRLQFTLKNVVFPTAEPGVAHGADDADGRHYVGLVVPRIEANASYSMQVELTDPVGDQNLSVEAYLRYPWFGSLADARSFLTDMKERPVAATGCLTSTQGQQRLNNCFSNMASHSFDAVQARGDAWNLAHPTVPIAPISHETIVSSFATDLLKSLDASLAGGVHPVPDATSRASVRSAKVNGRDKPQSIDPIQFIWHVLTGHDPQQIANDLGDRMNKVLRDFFRDGFTDVHYVYKKSDYALSACGDSYTITETWCNIFTPYDCHTLPPYKQSVNRDPPDFTPKPQPSGGSCPAGNGPSSVERARPLNERAFEATSCPEPDNPDPVAPPSSSQCSNSAGSLDPNDKTGLNGDGSAGHFIRSQPLSYMVAFENQPTATLPASQVVVTDQLDLSKVDISTLTLGTISFGRTTIDVPPGVSSFAKTQSIDSTLSVRVQGSVNTSTGMVKWTFTSVDPVTGLPPSDPTLGFLPPDTDGVRGQGYVSFTVMPKAGLPDATVWSNHASIVFDANAPILTPTWINTLDRTPPVGKVTSLTPQGSTASFEVAWSASDGGSGAGSYTVYVSDNGGAFGAWQTGVTTTSATYAGIAGHTYGFYVIATDKAGNAEAPKSAAEASITAAGTAGSGDVGGGGGGGCTIGAPGQRDAALALLLLLAVGVLWRRRYAPVRVMPTA